MQNQYTPDTVTAPGDTLLEVIEERSMSQASLADRLGLSQKTVNEIVKGKAPISYDTALALERVLGIPAGFWNRYEASYREHLARRDEGDALQESMWWLDQIPWDEAVNKGWLERKTTTLDQIREVLTFFGVASPKQYAEVYGSLSVRWHRPLHPAGDPGALALWLRRGEIEASHIDSMPYDEKAFARQLPVARGLSREEEPAVFRKTLELLCAEAGVAVVFVPELSHTRVCGAARWLNPNKALVQLSLRYKTNDQLWFAFFHESAHILLHSKKEVFLDDGQYDQSNQEREANRFAEEALIPERKLRSFMTGPLDDRRVRAFAEELGVAPGIVVGRLQKEGKIKYGQLEHLKVSYVWS